MPKSTSIRSRRAVLVDLARRHQVTDRRAATGRCLTASLDLAMAAQRRGLEVSLVRWTVRDDADFADHWAVRLDAAHVLDLTRTQVDGSSRLVVPVDDYPAGYVDRRDYPASLFLPRYAAVGADRREALPPGFLIAMARAMFRFDVVNAWLGFFPVRMLALCGELGRAHLHVARATAVKRLERRRAGLVQRLR